MTSVVEHAEFLLQAGGTLVPGRDLYIERPEDRELLELLRGGQYVNVLTSRQMGKSSLMVRTMRALHNYGIRTAAIDLAAELTGAADAEQWFLGLLNRLQRDLGLSLEIGKFWSAYPNDTRGQKLQRFFRDVACSVISHPIVVFLDEIDNTLKFDFADALFTSLRGMYNERALIPAYERLTFCLLGVAAPNELIKERRTTPYNIGVTLELRSFDPVRDDLKPLARTLSNDEATGKALLERVLYWTGGHPFLTMKLCSDLLTEAATTPASVDDYVERAFVSLDRVSGEVHFQQILRFIETRLSSGLETLDVYARLLNGEEIKEQTIPAHIDLKLSGLAKRDSRGYLVPQNRIYVRLFDDHWVDRLLPKKTAAVRASVARAYRGRLRMAAVASAAALLLAGYFGYSYYRAPPRPIIKAVEINNSQGVDVTVPKDASDLLTILSSIPNQSQVLKLDLSQTRIIDISALTRLTNLKDLDLSGTRISDISPLRGLANLQSLDLSSTTLSDISPLRELTNLQSLNLSSTTLSDISPLRELTNLQSLNLFHTQVDNISSLRGLNNLQSLNITGTNVSDISPLRGLTKLQSLSINSTKVSDISPLRGLTNLQSLSINSTTVSDISPLRVLTNLRSLNLSHTPINSISSISGLTSLRDLSLFGTQFADLTPITDLTSLSALYLDNNKSIRDISPLRSLQGLFTLSLTGLPITNISPLRDLVGLRILYLDNTNVSDLSPLQDLSKLIKLDLSGAPITNLAPLRNLRDLVELNVSNTAVDSAQVTDLRNALAPPKGRLTGISGGR